MKNASLVYRYVVGIDIHYTSILNVCIQEVLSMQSQLTDKLYYAIALVELGRVVAKESPDIAVKHFQTVLKETGFVWENTIKVHS